MDELKAPRPLAVVTGASSGIGYELAKQAAQHGYDLVVAADTPLEQACKDFEALGAKVDAVQCDLASNTGVQQLIDTIGGRQVDALCANAGHGLGGAFVDQAFEDILHVINTNVTGTVHLIHHMVKQMMSGASRQQPARVLVTGSIAGFQPGSFQAVYNGTKAFIDSFSFALRNELKDTGITVTCLMPGATDTEFFARAGLEDTKVGQGKKDDPATVARIGFEAMMKGEGDVVAGFKNKVQAAVAAVTPQSGLAEMHRKMAEPGSGEQQSR